MARVLVPLDAVTAPRVHGGGRPAIEGLPARKLQPARIL